MKTLIFAVLFFITHALMAQDTAAMEQLEVQFHYFKGNTFYGETRIFSKSEVRELMDGNEQAVRHFEKGHRHQNNATLVAIGGGLLVVWPIAAAIGGADNPGWIIAAGGAGLIGASIPIYNGGSRNIEKAIKLYNSTSTGAVPTQSKRWSVSFGATARGVGLQLNF